MSCNDGVCGTGGWGGPKPGDPSNNSVLSATPAFGGIDINWTFPTLNPFAVAHTRIYRALIDDVNAALVIVDPVGGSFYYDKVGPGVLYFYWIQFVSINGTQGELIGPASSTARASIEQTITDLTGQIDAGMLAQALKTQIALIPAIDAKILEEITNRLASNEALGNAIAQVQGVNEETRAFILNEISQRQTADTVLIESINTLFAQAAGNAAAITEEQTIRVTKDDALASRIDTLAASVNGDITAAIANEQIVRANADTALASDISTLYTKAGNNLAAILTESTARSNADSALATDITTLFTKAGDNTAAIQSEATARANAVSAETNARNTQYAAVSPAIAAAVQTETNARVSADNTLSNQITTAQSTLNGQISAVQTNLQTNIDTVNGKVTSIGALYTVKLNVNGLIGGFGAYNDGNTVQMGFDVDSFWVGRTGANMRKPFIISGSETFIDEAVINKLTFSKLRADDGSLIVENGKVKATYIEAVNITATSINVQNSVAGEGSLVMDNNSYRCYDENGTLRVRLGRLQ
jgi:hypothetical protein